jgi:hypothetical protein
MNPEAQEVIQHETDFLDDELPQAPTGGAAGQMAPVETLDVSEDIYATVPKMGDTIPAGTYHFRLDRWQKAAYEDGPVYSLQWRCQEEPHTGRVCFSNCPWPTAADIKTANDPSLPAGAKQEAQKRVNDRLVVAKAIQEAAGCKPGSMPFEDFLNTNPEMKLTIGVTEKKQRDAKLGADGKPKFSGTGENKNKVQKYISLHRPQ